MDITIVWDANVAPFLPQVSTPFQAIAGQRGTAWEHPIDGAPHRTQGTEVWSSPGRSCAERSIAVFRGGHVFSMPDGRLDVDVKISWYKSSDGNYDAVYLDL